MKIGPTASNYQTDPFGIAILASRQEGRSVGELLGRFSAFKTTFSPRIAILSLGRLRVFWNGNELYPADFNGRKNFYFLAYLASFPNRLASTELIMDQFWEGKSKSNLYAACSRIRKALIGAPEGCGVISEARGVAINPSITVCHDLDEVRLFRKRLANPLVGKREILFLAQKVTRLCQGPYLDGYDADWVAPTREYVRASLLDGLERALTLIKTDGQEEQTRQFAEKLFQLEPFHLGALRSLVELYAGSSDPIQAYRLIDRYKNGMREEFGVKDCPEADSLKKYLSVDR